MAGLTSLEGLRQQLETRWLGQPVSGQPVLVFLHEGLGSITQWRSFPEDLCKATGLTGLLFARQGYGRSSLRTEPARSDFMHREAREVLPALLLELGITAPLLVGHSDGASISLLYAGMQAAGSLGDAPAPLACCVMAPHLFVEADGVASIAEARKLFDRDASFRGKLGRHHDDVCHTFGNWADVWLSEDFKSWNISAETAQIRCPVLAIQGVEDQYGSLEQIRRIRTLIPPSTRVDLLEIGNCKHSPHLEKPAEVLDACKRFIETIKLCPQGDKP